MTMISDEEAKLALDLSKVMSYVFLTAGTKPYLNLSVLAILVGEQMIQAGVRDDKIDDAIAHFGEQIKPIYVAGSSRG